MATLTLKQVPSELLERLRQEAHKHRRSLNQQAIFLLEEAVASEKISFGKALDAFYKSAGLPEEGDADIFEDVRSSETGREVNL